MWYRISKADIPTSAILTVHGITRILLQISIPEDKLKLLQQKLALVTSPDELEDSGTKYGVPLKDIQRLVARWKDGFDWRAQEAALNAELHSSLATSRSRVLGF